MNLTCFVFVRCVCDSYVVVVPKPHDTRDRTSARLLGFIPLANPSSSSRGARLRLSPISRSGLLRVACRRALRISGLCPRCALDLLGFIPRVPLEVAWAQLIVCWLSRLGTESLPALPDDAPPGVDAPSPLPRPLGPCCRCHLSIACLGSIVPSLTVARAVL